ncbi:hypothetical protein BS78_05G150600 [Paspalum vaginatum]|nr:hypothetical protein BS78_05G150600 [Paspalum vaginatum]
MLAVAVLGRRSQRNPAAQGRCGRRDTLSRQRGGGGAEVGSLAVLLGPSRALGGGAEPIRRDLLRSQTRLPYDEFSTGIAPGPHAVTHADGPTQFYSPPRG